MNNRELRQKEERLEQYLWLVRRERTIDAETEGLDPEGDAVKIASLAREKAAAEARREEIRKAIDGLPADEKAVLHARHISLVPIRKGRDTVGFRRRRWEEVAAATGYSVRQVFRIRKAALEKVEPP